MKVTASVVVALSMAFSAAAQSTAAALLDKCDGQHDACDVAPDANHAFCASQYFSCIAPNDDCGCEDKSSACLSAPPSGNIFDCGPPLAACVVACENSPNVTATATATATSTLTPVSITSSVPVPVGTAPAASGSPVAHGNGTVVAPTPSAGFTGAATKAGLSVAGMLVAGAAMFL